MLRRYRGTAGTTDNHRPVCWIAMMATSQAKKVSEKLLWTRGLFFVCLRAQMVRVWSCWRVYAFESISYVFSRGLKRFNSVPRHRPTRLCRGCAHDNDGCRLVFCIESERPCGGSIPEPRAVERNQDSIRSAGRLRICAWREKRRVL